AREAPVSLLDLIRLGIALDAESLIIVLLSCHQVNTAHQRRLKKRRSEHFFSASSIGHQQPEMPLLVFVYVDVFGVDDVVIGSTARTRGRRRACCRSLIAGRLRTWRWSTLVKRLGQFMRSALQPVESVVQLLNASFGQRLLRVLNRRLNFRSNRSDFLAILAERLLHLVNESIE